MESKRYNQLIWVVFILFILLVTLPYIYAQITVGSEYSFSGFLLNPIDGNSYLAKMRQGYEGNWQFHLPYTSEDGEGSYLFLFYLFLGHLARIFDSSLLSIFYLARLLGAILLGFSLLSFCKNYFASARTRFIAFSLASLGSGLGWVVLLFGQITSDLWVSEAYPFLSAYTNPHFSIGLAIQLWLLNINEDHVLDRKMGFQLVLAGALLAEIAPFAIPVVIVIYAGLLLWKVLEKRNFREEFLRLVWVSIGSAPILLYDLWIINSDPILSSWNVQNVTSSPPAWDLFISMSPAILLAIWLIVKYQLFKDGQKRLLLVWLIVCFGLLYIPFNLQRRFLTGYFVPVAMLAAFAIDKIAIESKRKKRKIGIFLFSISLPTNLIVLLLGFFGVQTLDNQVVISSGEMSAYEWMDNELAAHSLILAGPDSGLYIPAYSFMRVMYGHPFETINAETRESETTKFFSSWDSSDQSTYIENHQVNYLLIGPRERELGVVAIQDHWLQVYENDDVIIYQVDR